jgi:hypothetical protein
MELHVTGPRDGKVDTGLEALVHVACKNFAKQLGISRLKTEIQVRMHHDLFVAEGCEGLCEPVSKRLFILDVALYGNWLSTLAHEMVHVRQFARGELNSNMSQWKSNKYCDNIEYWDQPWEKEARRLQGKLVEEFEKNP